MTSAPHLSSTHLLDYVRVLHKRRWPAIAVLGLVVAATAAYVTFEVPVYEARAELMIESARPQVVIFKDTIEQDSDKADYQQTQYKILESRGLATRVVETLGLRNNPELAGRGTPGAFRSVLDRVVALGSGFIGLLSTSAPATRASHGARAPDETPDRARAVDAFLDRLSIAPVRNSRLVDIKFQSVDPKLAADAVNALADAYIKQNLEFKSKTSKEASDWLAQQLEEQRRRVEASQAALQRYRERTDAVSSAERDSAVQQKLNELNAAVTRAHTTRMQKEFVFNQLNGADPAALEQHPAVAANAVVQNLRTELADLQRQEHQLSDTLGPRHPDRIKLRRNIEATENRIHAEAQKVVEVARTEFLGARSEEESLAAAVESQKRAATAARGKQTEYDALEREAASDRQIFDSLLQRAKETGVSSEMTSSNVRVVDAADVPRAPISPRKLRDIATATGVGLVLAVAVALFVEYLDKAIKTPDEVKAQLGLPCLGIVPFAVHDGPADGSMRPILSNGVPNQFKEAFRAVRTSILFSSTDEPRRTLLVTSTGPNEGKTMVAGNLALSMAQTGRRVLLIDGDLRRPSLHEVFSKPQHPGLSALSTRALRPEQVIAKTEVPELSLIAAGELPENPAEILSSEWFASFLDAVSAAYDWVIIDSPPVMAVTDAVLIAHVVGAVVFVVRAETTTAPVALNALEKLQAAHARFVGVVLNGVDLKHNAYYYADHYRPDYEAYYGVQS